MWHGASRARFVIVEPTATMRVQHYAGSRIERMTVAESVLEADTRSVCVILTTLFTTFQLTQSVAQVSRRYLSHLSELCRTYGTISSRFSCCVVFEQQVWFLILADVVRAFRRLATITLWPRKFTASGAIIQGAPVHSSIIANGQRGHKVRLSSICGHHGDNDHCGHPVARHATSTMDVQT